MEAGDMTASNGGDEYFASYDALEIHKLMLEDSPRTTAYQQAIEKAGVAGKVVLGKSSSRKRLKPASF